MIFLTGATGFVGSALLHRFIDNGSEVVALVRNESIQLQSGVKQVVGDLTNLSQSSGLAMTLKDTDVVVHTAARAHIMDGKESDPLNEYRKVNRDATLELARLALEAGVKRFVFVSSIGVNGDLNTWPFTENDVPFPHDNYSLSKYEAELGLLEIAKQTCMEVVIIRPPLVYGLGAPGKFGSLVKWIKKGVPLPLGSVHNLRSLVALDNLVDFMILCADRERSLKAKNEVFLISDGEDVSISNLLRKIANAYGVKSRLFPVPVYLMRFLAHLIGKGDSAEKLFGDLRVDSSKARDLLGWKPIIGMDNQLKKMVNSEDG
ncbi:epimerase [Hydrogenovibrio sp. SC-1]|uniref:NAD-dependent epimerase/dehydratase family protein n=1 Tax=Hydrogenovibrio sp. SC-1 TaxID=2065820 RepID=UPI000C797AE2|nr:NAD-dependent epimerase/dehydratase family protein [Hydrogenovibrio sp. SC-1]PLA75558.1 epimerase [Hydrogenovibrio sp. SC-1]